MSADSRAAFAAKYKDPRWQRKRLQIMERDKFTCYCCNDSATTLNVHHSYYVKGRDPWDYPDFALTTLCETCHFQWHAENSRFENWERVLAGLLDKADPNFHAFTLRNKLEREEMPQGVRQWLNELSPVTKAGAKAKH